jgi:hypothetical protein
MVVSVFMGVYLGTGAAHSEQVMVSPRPVNVRFASAVAEHSEQRVHSRHQAQVSDARWRPHLRRHAVFARAFSTFAFQVSFSSSFILNVSFAKSGAPSGGMSWFPIAARLRAVSFLLMES